VRERECFGHHLVVRHHPVRETELDCQRGGDALSGEEVLLGPQHADEQRPGGGTAVTSSPVRLSGVQPSDDGHPSASESARRAILRSTLRLLRHTGYNDLSIEGIAGDANVGKATVYRWWPWWAGRTSANRRW